MNRHLLRNWRRRVGAGDTVICLGDVAHPDAWRDDRLVLDLAECPGERGNAYRYERGARRNGEPVRTRAQQRAVAGRTVREHLRRAHRVPAAPARRRATAGLGTARRPAAGRRRRQRKSVAWTRSRPQRAEEVDRTSLEEGLRNATFPSAGWSRPRSYGVRRSAMIEDGSPTVIGRIIVSFSLASRPSFSTYCSATRNCAA